MIGVFKQKSPGNVAILFLFGLLLKLPLFLYPEETVATDNDGELYQWVISIMPSGSTTLFSIIAFLLLYIQALMINYLVSEYRLTTRPNYLPGMSYLLITSLLPEWNYFSAPLVSNTLIIALFVYLFFLYNAQQVKGHIYNLGLIAGINSYIYFPSIVFIICLLMGLMILKPFRLNEAILFILGCITPYYFHAAYLFLSDELSLANIFPAITVDAPQVKNSIWIAGSTLLLAIPFLAGGYFVQSNLRKMLIQVRKNWSIILLYLLLAFFVPFINSADSFYTWVLIAAPFSTFHACTYFYGKRWLALSIFFITLCFILYMQYGTDIWK